MSEFDEPMTAPSGTAGGGEVIEPDLLWVESVTERLLGPGMGDAFPREGRGSVGWPGPEPAASTHYPPPVAEPEPPPVAEPEPPAPAPEPPPRARHAAPGATSEPLSVQAVRLVLRSQDPEVRSVIAGLLAELSDALNRLHRAERWLEVVLEEAEPALPGAAELRGLRPGQ